MKEIIVFEIDGKCPFEEWLNSLKDIRTRYRVNERLKRIKFGNYGDCKKIDKELSELRLMFGSGYRIYFSEIGNTLVILLSGGDKSTQSKDIKKAKEYLTIWKGQKND